ncbi:unnamed protein product [Rhodiola kirilowii]
MASMSSATLALFLSLNVLLFTIVTANHGGCPPPLTSRNQSQHRALLHPEQHHALEMH